MKTYLHVGTQDELADVVLLSDGLAPPAPGRANSGACVILAEAAATAIIVLAAKSVASRTPRSC